jgi:transposase-like protein
MPQPIKRRRGGTHLDAEKRRIVIAMLANGSSRRAAAATVGCAPSTITRAAVRDREFGRQIARAERNVEIQSLKQIREAGKLPRYWRAAAWMLERKNPDDFAARLPKTFTRVEVAAVLSNVCEMLVDEVPEEDRRRIQAYLDRLMFELRNEMAHAADFVPPALVPEIPEPPGRLATAADLDELAKDEEEEEPGKDGGRGGPGLCC